MHEVFEVMVALPNGNKFLKKTGNVFMRKIFEGNVGFASGKKFLLN